jgi:hypothetical protein
LIAGSGLVFVSPISNQEALACRAVLSNVIFSLFHVNRAELEEAITLMDGTSIRPGYQILNHHIRVLVYDTHGPCGW